jgi:hypothetical protein
MKQLRELQFGVCMKLPTKPLTIIEAVRSIWRWSIDSLQAKPKATLPIAIASFGIMVLVVLALTLLIGVTFPKQEAKSAMSLPVIINMIIFMGILLLTMSFISGAMISRVYAYLTDNDELAKHAWHNAKNRTLPLFATVILLYVINIGIQLASDKLMGMVPGWLNMILLAIKLMVTLFLTVLPFLIYTAIVIERAPISHALGQGFRLLLKTWLPSFAILFLGFVGPLFLIVLINALLAQIPILGFLLVFIVICVTGPLFLILASFCNVLIYHNAKLLANGTGDGPITIQSA